MKTLMKNANTVYMLLVFVSVFLVFLNPVKSWAQNVPDDVKTIVGMKLEAGQAKLGELGYEICYSSMFGKKQDWVNEKAQLCVTVKFNKKEEITDVSLNPETAECLKKLKNEQKMWENYHDGQAAVNDAKVNEERKKLADAGFVVSYWVNDVSPGRSAEYWVNESAKKVKSIVWETASGKWAMTNDSDYSMGKNPAPKK
jgi:hypothetical protein